MILMCKNTEVYDIKNKTILSKELIPRSILYDMTFEEWTKHRKSVLSNETARLLYFTAFGHENEEVEIKKTRMLSLSDCYWTKERNENILFENISPYCTDFWKGFDENYNEGAIPTLYLSGSINKYWLDNKHFFKENCKIELLAYELAGQLNVPCNKITESTENGREGIVITNFTDINNMFEPAACTGKFKNTFFASHYDVEMEFGDSGLTMIAFDAITGNIDRHIENFGYIRDSNTGEYLKMAPLFDFNLILGATGHNDYLIKNVPNNEITKELCYKTLEKSNNEIFKFRAKSIIERYYELPTVAF